MRIALGLEYSGAAYHGWQKQPTTDKTIQTQLELALAFVAGESVSVVCAGRTDAGVHARGQIVHFDTDAQRPDHAWVLGTNTPLPKDIRVIWSQQVPETFHARFSALSRRYQFIIDNNRIASPFSYQFETHHRARLDDKSMQQAAQYLLGRHDFNAYRASSCQAHSPSREITYIDLRRVGNKLFFEVQANAFLHHMVRNIMGVLIEIGEGNKPAIWAKEVLEGRSRALGGKTAAPNGLYLLNVDYPDECGFSHLQL